MEEKCWTPKWIVAGIFFGALFIVGYILAIKALWNWLVPDLFGGSEITLWQTIGLVALIKLLFMGSCGGGWQSKWKHKKHKHYHNWKHKFDEKCNEVTEDQKESSEDNQPTP